MKRIFLLMIPCLFIARLAWASAGQAIQQQRQMQEMAIQKAVAEQQIQQQIAVQQQIAAQQQIVVQEHIALQTQPRPSPTGEEYIVSLKDVFKSLETSSKAWALMIDRDPKILVVTEYIDYFKDNQIKIKKPAEYYVDLIDMMAEQDPAMLKTPFRNVFQLVSILEYDFDNGQDKDKMIINLLGREGYLQNKQRLGLP